MLGDDAVPSCTWHVPSLRATYHWPPLSPLRLNWMVEFMPFAASAFRFLGISAKIALGVMQTPPLRGWGFEVVLGHAARRCQGDRRHVIGGTSGAEPLEQRAGERRPAAALLVLEVHVDA